MEIEIHPSSAHSFLKSSSINSFSWFHDFRGIWVSLEISLNLFQILWGTIGGWLEYSQVQLMYRRDLGN
jgi:hypothetical protein